jgi:hypothetical protein
LYVVPLLPDKNPFAVQLNNNKYTYATSQFVEVMTLKLPELPDPVFVILGILPWEAITPFSNTNTTASQIALFH